MLYESINVDYVYRKQVLAVYTSHSINFQWCFTTIILYIEWKYYTADASTLWFIDHVAKWKLLTDDVFIT